MKQKDNIIYFDNDNEITDYCINMQPTIHHDPKLNISYYTYDYTPQYNKAISDNIKFVIKDAASKVKKHKAAVRGIMTIPIQNIEY